jgi:hypothetical protein
VGFSAIEEIRGDEQALNAQRAFQTLGESLNEIDRQQVPGRSGEISLSGGTLLADSGADGPAFEVSTSTGEWQSVDDTDAVCDVGSDGRVIVRRTVVEIDFVS